MDAYTLTRFLPSFWRTHWQLPTVLITLLGGTIVTAYLSKYSVRRAHARVKGEDSISSKSGPSKYTFDGTRAMDEVRQRFDSKSVRIAKLLIHPIKSCRGISVTEVNVSPHGVENDRRWSIIDASSHRIFTARAVPKMVLITPKIIEDESDTSKSRLEISFPPDSGCETFSIPLRPTSDVLSKWQILKDCSVFSYTGIDGYITQPWDERLPSTLCSETLSKYFGKPVHLIFKGPHPRYLNPTLNFPNLSMTISYQDGYPMLVASQESFEAVHNMVRDWAKSQEKLAEDVPKHVESMVIERFRPNVVLQGAGLPFVEDMMREITITSATTMDSIPVSLVSKCTRCMLPNVDPADGKRNMSVPSKPLAQHRTGLDPARLDESCFGCNSVPEVPGVLRVGDIISVRQWASV